MWTIGRKHITAYIPKKGFLVKGDTTMEEIWKDVVGYEGLYQVSNLGRVRSFVRGNKILKNVLSDSGYYAIILTNNKKHKRFYIHRLVAKTFINGENNLCEVNHIDGNKLNNNVYNLEWVSRSQNIKHAVRIGLYSKEVIEKKIIKMNNACKKKVLQIKDGIIIKEYDSISQATRETKINNISACALGKIKSCGGYQWKYKEKDK